MIELECPNCAGRGSVPNDKATARMVCKKCHMVFHMTPTGRTMLGEPPVAGKEKDNKKTAHDPGHASGGASAAKKRDFAEGLFEFNRVQILAGVLAVGMLGLGCFVVMAGGGKDILSQKAQEMADAVSAGNVSSVKGLSRSEGADAAVKWYDSVHSQYEGMKKSSPGQGVLASVFVIEENHAKREGQALILFAPAAGSTREQSIAKAAGVGTTPGDQSITQILTFWVLDRGYWRLDGTRTAAVAPTAAPATVSLGR